jgi:hypothetical protein
LEPANSFFCSVDKACYSIDSPVRNIRATEKGHISLFSEKNIKCFYYSNEGMIESLNCIPPSDHSFSAYDVHKTSTEISSILKSANILQVYDEYSK